jgi:hypothetical protein
VSIRFTPSSTTRRRRRLAASGSSGGPQMPSPVMRIAPKPTRLTSRSPPMVKVAVTASESTRPAVYTWVSG